MILAGFPATETPSLIDFVTLEAIPTNDFFPILIFCTIDEFGPIHVSSPTSTPPLISTHAAIRAPFLIIQLCAI